MEHCILPIEKEPVIRVYQHVAYSFGILGSNQDSYNWLCNQYTQLIDDGQNDITFYLEFLNKQDAFDYERVQCETLQELKIDVVEFIRNEIKNGWYVYICVDEFYIPKRTAYQKVHFIHDCLVYGMDDRKREFCIIGYNDEHMYSESRVTYEQLRESTPRYWICSLRKNEQYKFLLDINKIHIDLKRYLNLEPEIIIGDFNPESAVFGQETNQSLIRYIENQCFNKQRMDIRYPYLFYEHKKAMLIRLEKLQEVIQYDKGYVMKYQEIVKEAKGLVMISLKYNMTFARRICEKMVGLIKNVEIKERKIILDVIDRF